MCIRDRNDAIGTVELTGATRDCSLLLVPDAKVGDWLLVHAGFAVQIVDEEEAQKTLEAFKAVSYTHLDVYKRQFQNLLYL